MENISLEEWGTYDTISYVAAIHMLLDERELVFNEYENIVAPSITVENECWQVVKVKTTGENEVNPKVWTKKLWGLFYA